MMPQLRQALADEHTRDRERAIAARRSAYGEGASSRPHRVGVRVGYWLISVGCRLVAPDLTAAAQ
ncbi:MAG TPA: hypothetical protein VME70_14455 [Mycobacteriales bacterium]|nr:hypothetical protein [Mycobacteriales bacterium]